MKANTNTRKEKFNAFLKRNGLSNVEFYVLAACAAYIAAQLIRAIFWRLTPPISNIMESNITINQKKVALKAVEDYSILINNKGVISGQKFARIVRRFFLTHTLPSKSNRKYIKEVKAAITAYISTIEVIGGMSKIHFTEED